MRALRGLLLAGCLSALALPASASAAEITFSGGVLQFTAAPGETNTAVIAERAPGVYFVGDQNPDVDVTAPPLICNDTALLPGDLPPGFLCTPLVAATSVGVSLGDGNDTGVINTTGTPGTFDGGPGDDLLVGGTQDDDFAGGADDDSVAYVGIDAAGISRTDPVDAQLAPFPSGAATTGNGTGTESDTIRDDIEGLIGGNGDDSLTGNDGPNTIAGAAPAGTPAVSPGPGGNDTVNGAGGDDTLLGGATGTVSGGPGDDQIVGGSGPTGTTVLDGGPDDDTIVSGAGNDDISGGEGSNTLAYASVQLGPITVVDRGTGGVMASLPSGGSPTGSGGQKGTAEADVIRDGIGTLVGSNGDDVLTGSDGRDVILGAAPAGTGGVAPGPAGNDTLNGRDGPDILLGAEGADILDGGPGLDIMTAGAGNDDLRTRDGVVEAPSCGDGTDTVASDPDDVIGPDCERNDDGRAPPPPVDAVAPKPVAKPALLILRKGRKVSVALACPNEAAGCSGSLTLQTRGKVRLRGGAKKRYTLGRVTFATTDRGRAKKRVRLSKATTRLVAPGRSLKLRGVATVADAAGNATTKTFKLRLKRPRR